MEQKELLIWTKGYVDALLQTDEIKKEQVLILLTKIEELKCVVEEAFIIKKKQEELWLSQEANDLPF